MTEQMLLQIIEMLGDDAKSAFYAYLFCEYGIEIINVWLLMYCLYRGVKWFYKNHKI